MQTNSKTMSTAQAFYEVFKALPKSAQKEVRQLIAEDTETILISSKDLQDSVSEIKKLKAGKARILGLEDLRKEITS